MAEFILKRKAKPEPFVLKRKTAEPEIPLADVPGNMLQNAIPDAGNQLYNMAQPFIHPIDTAQGIGRLVAGVADKAGAGDLNAWLADKGLARRRDPADVEQSAGVADAVGQYYKDRYGGWENIKRTASNEPIGFLMDVSTPFTGGGMLAAKTLGQGSKVARALSAVGDVTNPLTAVGKAAQLSGKIGKPIVKGVLGATTGTSADTIGEAYNAGRKGSQYAEALRRNMRGLEEQDAVIGEAKDAIGNIADARRSQYQTDMASVNADKTPIDFSPIEKRLQDLVDDSFKGGHQTVSDETMAKLKKIGEVVDEWSKDPAMHNAGGMDALKRRIDDIMPSFSEKTANTERIVTATRNTVKDAITTQAPQYAKAMEGYEQSKAVQKEIEKSLSLGKGNSADTALRKLQSLTRNNVNTNYGGRMKSADILEQNGAKTLKARLAGQALNAWMPRGILRSLTGGGIAAAATGLLQPSALAALPMLSPRVVGEGAALAGTLARKLEKVPKPTKEQLLLLRLLGSTRQQTAPGPR